MILGRNNVIISSCLARSGNDKNIRFATTNKDYVNHRVVVMYSSARGSRFVIASLHDSATQ